jgi:hypothetical protein
VRISWGKFFSIGVILLSVMLLAPMVWAADAAGKAEIAFSEGLLSYKSHNYDAAAKSFSRAASLNPKKAEAQYFLGLAQFQRGNYTEAITAFDASIALKGDVAEPYFYRGLSAYRMGQKEKAAADFKKSHAMASPGPIKDLSQSFMRNIDAGEEIAQTAEEEAKRWYLYASLSTSYDSNVSLNPESLSVANLPSNTKDAEFALRGGGGYRVVDKKHFQLTPEAFYYQSLHPRLDGYNYGLAHVGLQNKAMVDRWTFGVPVTYEFSILGSAKFLGVPTFSPTVSYFWMDRMLTQVSAPVAYNDFFQTAGGAQNRDAWNLRPGIAQYVFFNDRKHYVAASYNYEKNWASGNDWDYHANTIGVSGLFPLPWQMDFYVFGNFTFNYNFDNVDSVIGTRRKDTLYMVGANLSKNVMKHLDVSLHYNYWNEQSNQAFFTYNRNLVGVTVGVTY